MSNEYSAPSEYAPTYIQLERAHKDLKEQRDDLLEALKGICELYDTDEGTRSLPQYVAAISAITNAEASE